MKPKLRFYFSFRSPYAWLALRALDEKGAGMDSNLAYLPYFAPEGACLAYLNELGGKFLYQPMCEEKHLYIMQDAKRIMEKQGVTPKLPSDQDPDWSIPHLVFLATQDLQIGQEFTLDAMEARWLEGIDIWSWDSVRSLLARRLSAPDVEKIINLAQSERILREAAAHLHQAYKDEVFGVPFMRVGRNKFWGQDRIDAFLELAAPKLAKQPSKNEGE